MNLLSHFSIICVLVLVQFRTTEAQWNQTRGPCGGTVLSLATHVGNLFAGTTAGVYRSSDAGTTWTAANRGLSWDYHVTALTSIGVHLYAAVSSYGVFESIDNGENWEIASSGFWNIFCLASRDTVLFAGTSLGVYRTTDLGTTWVPSGDGMPPETEIHAFAVMGTNIFAATNPGVFLSTDDGSHWVSVSNGFPATGANVISLAASGSRLFAGTWGDGVYVSTDSGAGWAPANAGQSLHRIDALAAQGTRVFAGGTSISRSTDSGTTWMSASDDSPFSAVNCLLVSNAGIFAGTEGTGTFLSSNDGASWSSISTGLPFASPTAFASTGDSLFVGTRDAGIFLSTNGGDSWTMKNNGLGGNEVSALSPMNGYLFAGIKGRGVFRSSDGGALWIARLGHTDVRDLAVSSAGVFAGMYGAGVWASTDNGVNWSPRNNGLTNQLVLTLGINSTTLIAGTLNGLFRSTDFGDNWTPCDNGIPATYCMVLGVNGGNLYAGTGNGLYHSSDNGTTWSKITGYTVESLAFNGPAVIRNGGGVYFTTDNGTSWRDANEGLPPYTEGNMGPLCAHKGYLFGGMSGAGVWQRSLSELVSAGGEPELLPGSSRLDQNYPNPFNPDTRIAFDLPKRSRVSLKVFDVLGREVLTLLDDIKEAGRYEVPFRPVQSASGVYFYRLKSDGFVLTRKMIFQK